VLVRPLGCVRFCPGQTQGAPWKPGIDPAEPKRLCASFPGLEVSLGKLLEHGLVELLRWPTMFELEYFSCLHSLSSLASLDFIFPP